MEERRDNVADKRANAASTANWSSDCTSRDISSFIIANKPKPRNPHSSLISLSLFCAYSWP